jgi:hypothetical protein
VTGMGRHRAPGMREKRGNADAHYLRTLIPAWSFCFRRSVLFRRSTSEACFRSLFEHTAVQSWSESSIRFTRESSSRYCRCRMQKASALSDVRQARTIRTDLVESADRGQEDDSGCCERAVSP